MTQTSINAFYDVQFSGKVGTQKALIMNYLKTKKKATRREIAKALHMETSTMSARINSLRDEHNLVTDTNTTICPISKKTVHLVELKGLFS